MKRRLVALPAWSAPEARTLVLLLLLVPAVFVLPYRNLGARDAEGNRFYRAYFTADFIWHMALTAELTKYAMPPINPYLGDRTIQYYWTYFLVPAVISEEGVGGLREIENVAQGQRALLRRAFHRGPHPLRPGRVALCAGHRIRGRACGRGRERRRAVRVVGFVPRAAGRSSG